MGRAPAEGMVRGIGAGDDADWSRSEPGTGGPAVLTRHLALSPRSDSLHRYAKRTRGEAGDYCGRSGMSSVGEG